MIFFAWLKMHIYKWLNKHDIVDNLNVIELGDRRDTKNNCIRIRNINVNPPNFNKRRTEVSKEKDGQLRNYRSIDEQNLIEKVDYLCKKVCEIEFKLNKTDEFCPPSRRNK